VTYSRLTNEVLLTTFKIAVSRKTLAPPSVGGNSIVETLRSTHSESKQLSRCLRVPCRSATGELTRAQQAPPRRETPFAENRSGRREKVKLHAEICCGRKISHTVEKSDARNGGGRSRVGSIRRWVWRLGLARWLVFSNRRARFGSKSDPDRSLPLDPWLTEVKRTFVRPNHAASL